MNEENKLILILLFHDLIVEFQNDPRRESIRIVTRSSAGVVIPVSSGKKLPLVCTGQLGGVKF